MNDANARLGEGLKEGNLRRVRTALDKGADPNAPVPPQDRSPLYWAAASGDMRLVELLLQAGAKPVDEKAGTTSLHAAAASGEVPMLQALLRAGGKRVIDRLDDNDRTPLMLAVENGRLDAARALLEAGADVNAREAMAAGETAIRIAAASGSLEMVTLLMSAGADPRVPGRMGLTALDRARERRTPVGRMITAYMIRQIEPAKPARKAKAKPRRKARARGRATSR